MAKKPETAGSKKPVDDVKSLRAELKELRDDAKEARAELKKAQSELDSQREKLAQDHAAAPEISLKHEAESKRERKFTCTSVDPVKMLERARKIWSDNAGEANKAPVSITTLTCRVETEPLGGATPLPAALIDNCSDKGAAVCQYFSEFSMPPGNYKSRVSIISKETHGATVGK